MALNPIESGEFIVKNAKYIEVKDFGIKNLANQVKIRMRTPGENSDVIF